MASINSSNKSLINFITKEINGKRKGCLSNTDLSNVLKCIVTELCDSITDVANQVNSNDALVSVLQTQIIQEIADRAAGDANLQNQIDQLSSDDSDILAQLAQEIADRIAADANLQFNIDQNSTAIAGNDSDIAALQAEDINLQSQIDTNDNELTLQQAQIVSNDVDIADLQGRVNQNETDIAVLQAGSGGGGGPVTSEQIEIIFDGYPTFTSMTQALATLGVGKIFVYAETNQDGVPSPNGSAIAITKPN